MLFRLLSLVVLLLAATTASPAQESPSSAQEDSGPAQDGVTGAHGAPSCPYSDASCVWGSLLAFSGRERFLRPMQKGPIDVCHSWDYNCSSPVQTVCELHGPHRRRGHGHEEGSYFFVLRTNQGWRVKPRVVGSHQSWRPASRLVSAGAAPGRTRVFNFVLQASAPSTSTCSD